MLQSPEKAISQRRPGAAFQSGVYVQTARTANRGIADTKAHRSDIGGLDDASFWRVTTASAEIDINKKATERGFGGSDELMTGGCLHFKVNACSSCQRLSCGRGVCWRNRSAQKGKVLFPCHCSKDYRGGRLETPGASCLHCWNDISPFWFFCGEYRSAPCDEKDKLLFTFDGYVTQLT